jgi:4-amino-4-deoxy-L-arabinose transferase-like glycosyltransferase
MPMRVAPEGWILVLPFMILAALALLMQWTIAAIVLGAIALFFLNRARLRRRDRGATT